MLTIREDQITAISEANTGQFCAELAQFYRANVPQLVQRFDDERLNSRIRAALGKARGWQIVDGKGILQFVALALAAGSAFDEDEKVRAFLSGHGLKPTWKIHTLLNLVGQNLQRKNL